MSITFQLANFPLLNQNSEDPAHEYPDVNAGMDCVPTSIAAALTWFTGQQFYGDQLIDQNPTYGSSYHGGTAAFAYVSQVAASGVRLYPVNGAADALVADLHALVHQNQPCLITIPGQWNSPATSGANPGPVTHVCVVCGDGPGEIRAMNPWGGFMMDVTDSWLVNKLCYGQIWPMEKTVKPTGPFYLVKPGYNGVPTSGDALAGALGLTWQDLVAIKDPNGPADNSHLAGYDPSGPYLYRASDGYSEAVWVPGWLPPPAPTPVPANDPKAEAVKTALKDWLAS